MNKLDIFTVAVVFLCVLAIVFLLWRATGLFGSDRPTPADQVDQERIERLDETRNAERTRPLPNSDDDDDDDNLLDRAGRTGGRVLDGVGNAADRAAEGIGNATDRAIEGADNLTDRAAEGIGNAADRVRDALREDDEAARRDGVREETRDLEIPESYSNRPGSFLVMGGTFGVYDNAVNQRRALRTAGFQQAEVTRFNGGKYAVVLVDRFERYRDAKTEVDRVREVVPDAFVLRKRMGSR